MHKVDDVVRFAHGCGKGPVRIVALFGKWAWIRNEGTPSVSAPWTVYQEDLETARFVIGKRYRRIAKYYSGLMPPPLLEAVFRWNGKVLFAVVDNEDGAVRFANDEDIYTYEEVSK